LWNVTRQYSGVTRVSLISCLTALAGDALSVVEGEASPASATPVVAKLAKISAAVSD